MHCIHIEKNARVQLKKRIL